MRIPKRSEIKETFEKGRDLRESISPEIGFRTENDAIGAAISHTNPVRHGNCGADEWCG